MFSLFSFINSSNLRKNEETIPEIDSLKEGLPKSYELLQKVVESRKPQKAQFLNLAYFKELELNSNSNVEFFLDKEPNDFDSLMTKIIEFMGISNQDHAYVHDIVMNKITQYEKYHEYNTWTNYNIITTVRNEEKTISFGSLFVSINKEKYNIIFCYGSGIFNADFSADNVVFLGAKGDWKYVETSRSASYSSGDFTDDDMRYIIRYMNLVGFKVIGNKYGLQLPDPNIN